MLLKQYMLPTKYAHSRSMVFIMKFGAYRDRAGHVRCLYNVYPRYPIRTMTGCHEVTCMMVVCVFGRSFERTYVHPSAYNTLPLAYLYYINAPRSLSQSA